MNTCVEKEYSDTIDTELEWIGMIPAHWKITKMKTLFSNKSVKNHPDATVLSLYREYGVIPKDSRDDNHNATSENTAAYKFVEVGNLVINKMKAWQGSLAISDYEGIVSPAYYVCAFKNNSFIKRYFHYLLRSKPYAQEFERLSTGMRIGQWDLGIDDFMRIPAIIPPKDEQMRIAQYLDEKCKKIDYLSSEAKESIDKYKDLKDAIVFETITQGIKKSVELKQVNSEWLKAIPANWEQLPLKRVLIARDGGAWGSDSVGDDNDRICMRIADFDFFRGRFNNALESEYTVRNYQQNQISKLTLSKGDILIEKSGGGEKTPVGRSVLFDKEFDALYANFMERLRVDTTVVIPEFFEYWLQAMYSKLVMIPYIKQTTGIQNLNVSSLLEKEVIAFPGIKDQEEIVESLDNICEKITSIISEKSDLINDLDAYKKALIFEIVTGKICVE